MDPIGPVSDRAQVIALLAGPIASLACARVLTGIARRRSSFAWSTAAFANASIRLFSGTLDVIAVLRDRTPFSDEGRAALLITHDRPARASMVLVVLVLSATLTFAAGRAFRFARHAFIKCVGIYVLTLMVGIAAVVLDDLRK